MNENMKFEEAIRLLENEVAKLEGGNMPLDEALSSFERSVGLVKLCNKMLEQAEGKVRILTETADGSVTDAPFSEIGDED